MLPEFILSSTAIAWITAIFAITIGLIVKDILINVTSGILFYLNKNFNEGDHVYLDGEPALIVRIGFRYTVFEVEKDNKRCWRFISNDRVKFSKMEKIISIKIEDD